jgi:nucleoside-triphosphatase
MIKNILLTGPPRVGKTTLIKEIISKINKEKICGFYTEEIKARGKRVGFAIRGLDGETGILAHIDVKSNKKVGKYKIKLDDLEKIAVKEIEKGNNLIIIDEIGKMELFSNKFKQAVTSALNSKSIVVGTIGMIEDKFVKEIKNRVDVTIINLTRDNYQQVKDIIIKELNSSSLQASTKSQP